MPHACCTRLSARARRLAQLFPRTVDGITVVMHDRTASLMAASPLLALAWAASARPARRYLAGWVTRDEIHLLAPSVLAAPRVHRARLGADARARAGVAVRAPGDPASATTSCTTRTRRRRPRMLRWAWLLEGGARWFSGETAHARAAIARRLHEGGQPSFPPGLRDAALLGGTVIDLVAREQGEQAAAQFATRLHPQGPRAALVKAFEGRPLVHTEGAWRSHLARLVSAG